MLITLVTLRAINSSAFYKTYNQHHSLIKEDFQFPEFESLNFYLMFVNSRFNFPNREQSDQCIFEILNDCKTSIICDKIEKEKIKSFGYAATHK